MPNFPDSIYSPASKSAGQTITAAFFNDPDGEITAIETGYINGTARLNSSNLNVTGASTFTNRPVMPPPEAVRVELVANTSFPASTQAISWTAQAFATNSSMHSTVTNPMRLTPQSTGIYRIDLNVVTSTGGNTQNILWIKDSSGGIVASLNQSFVGSSGTQGFYLSGLKRFDSVTGSTQWVRAVMYFVASTGHIVASTAFVPHMSMVKL